MHTALKAYPFDFKQRSALPRGGAARESHPVVVVGGGVAGLTAALALAAQGVKTVVIEADDTVCYGSRAICISRRSLEIYDRLGVAEALLAVGLPWTGGRSYYRDREVLHFTMPHDQSQKLPPMVNMQQYYLEEALVQACEKAAGTIDLRWNSRVTAVPSNDEQGALLQVESGRDRYEIQADWVIAADGGRSFMREALGLQLKGTAYEGRYVVADIELETDLPTERLAWFDPPSNPGSTILMHKQPDNVWRIDYQLREGEDPEEAVKPENVLPRVKAHLDMIGQTGEWSPLWITIYKANALTLERYLHGSVLFAGDAAHLVPIFGVRGANSAIDDVDNLAWKLAAVLHGKADRALLDSYSEERVFAAHENLKSGMKSTEFMAPPTFAFKLMREAVLSLAGDTPGVRSLINPRQTSAIAYADSSLNAPDSEDAAFRGGPAAGTVLPNAPVVLHAPPRAPLDGHLCDHVPPGRFLILHFAAGQGAPADVADAHARLQREGVDVDLLPVVRGAGAAPQGVHLLDPTGAAFRLYDAEAGATYLVRPDGHVAGRWRSARPDGIVRAATRILHPSNSRTGGQP